MKDQFKMNCCKRHNKHDFFVFVEELDRRVDDMES